MDRTLRFPLNPTTEQAEILPRTMRESTQSFNLVCAEGWRLKEGSAYALHRLTYRDSKALYPRLVSDLHVQARQKAAEAVKSALSPAKLANLTQERTQGRPSRLQLCPPRYNCNWFSVDWQEGLVNLATVCGRQRVAFTVPTYADAVIGNRVATADLVYRKGRFTLHVVLKLDDVEFTDNGTATGVDLGVCRPAVTSDNRFHGQKSWRQVEHRRHHRRRKLQAKGTRPAKRRLRLLAGHSQRFRRDCDHVPSKRILNGSKPIAEKPSGVYTPGGSLNRPRS